MGRFAEFLVELQAGVILRQRAIGRGPFDIEVDEFDVATWQQISIKKGNISGWSWMDPILNRADLTLRNLLATLTDKSRPVFDRNPHKATMDVVEFLVICPFGFNIIHLEPNIWGNPVIV